MNLDWFKTPIQNGSYHDWTGFISNSFLGDFEECQFGALTKFTTPQEKEFNETFATGHAVEAKVFGGQQGFDAYLARVTEHAYMKSGKAYAWVTKANDYADAIIRQAKIMKLLAGGIYHQTIAFEMFGFAFKAEVDYMNVDKKIEVDLKTTASNFVDHDYNPLEKVRNLTFIDKYNYHRQRAIYREAIVSQFAFVPKQYILAVSKTTKSVKLFHFDDAERLDNELRKVEGQLEVLKDILAGEAPLRCGICEYCVATEIIDSAILVSKFGR